MAAKLPKAFLEKLRAVTGKRPKTVIDHILQHGHITTEELRDVYGYDHPPRAVKDVTDLGIPIERFPVKGKHGRTIAAYRFGDTAALRGPGYAGRRLFPKKFKQSLIERNGNKCALCSGVFTASDLQIDHRVPYAVAGEEAGEPRLEDYQLVCRSCNRAKSWSCEHCNNWLQDKNPGTCMSCFWANPTSYRHIAMRPVRRLNLVWMEGEVSEYDSLADLSKKTQMEIPEYVKDVLRQHLRQR
jgi:hypothetical protein